MLKMETEKFFIQFLEFGLDGSKCFLYGFFSCVGDNHNQEFFFFGGGKVGRKTKRETVSVEENMDLGKNRKGNLGLSNFLDTVERTGKQKMGILGAG